MRRVNQSVFFIHKAGETIKGATPQWVIIKVKSGPLTSHPAVSRWHGAGWGGRRWLVAWRIATVQTTPTSLVLVQKSCLIFRSCRKVWPLLFNHPYFNMRLGSRLESKVNTWSSWRCRERRFHKLPQLHAICLSAAQKKRILGGLPSIFYDYRAHTTALAIGFGTLDFYQSRGLIYLLTFIKTPAPTGICASSSGTRFQAVTSADLKKKNRSYLFLSARLVNIAPVAANRWHLTRGLELISFYWTPCYYSALTAFWLNSLLNPHQFSSWGWANCGNMLLEKWIKWRRISNLEFSPSWF